MSLLGRATLFALPSLFLLCGPGCTSLGSGDTPTERAEDPLTGAWLGQLKQDKECDPILSPFLTPSPGTAAAPAVPTCSSTPTPVSPELATLEILPRLDRIQSELQTLPLSNEAQARILAILSAAPAVQRSELSWRLIGLGLDRPLLRLLDACRMPLYRAKAEYRTCPPRDRPTPEHSSRASAPNTLACSRLAPRSCQHATPVTEAFEDPPGLQRGHSFRSAGKPCYPESRKMIQRASNRGEYLRCPLGQFLEGPKWVRFCLREDFVGGIFWGRVSDPELRAYLDLVIDELQRLGPQRLTYLDLSRVETVEQESFLTLYTFYTGHGSDLRRSFARVAGVHPSGLTGALLGGLPLVQPFPYPAQFFADTTSALEFLGVADPAVVTLLEELREQVANREVLLYNLQTLLENEPTRLTVADAARTLGMSDRSLQRRLQQLGSSFLAESTAARIRLAKRLLVASDKSLLAIALEVGCSSAQHFSGMFRKATGHSPSAWRARARRCS